MTLRSSQPTNIRHAVDATIEALGYDQDSQHFKRTPERFAELLSLFAENEDGDAVREILDVRFNESYSELVMVGPIEYISMCAHHLVPVTGFAWVGYIPNEAVVGLSKLAYLVDHFARQLTVQERVTEQIANALFEHLKPLGCMVVVRANHGCMSIRGPEEPFALTITSAVRGVHKDSDRARQEFLSLMRDPK